MSKLNTIPKIGYSKTYKPNNTNIFESTDSRSSEISNPYSSKVIIPPNGIDYDKVSSLIQQYNSIWYDPTIGEQVERKKIVILEKFKLEGIRNDRVRSELDRTSDFNKKIKLAPNIIEIEFDSNNILSNYSLSNKYFSINTDPGQACSSSAQSSIITDLDQSDRSIDLDRSVGSDNLSEQVRIIVDSMDNFNNLTIKLLDIFFNLKEVNNMLEKLSESDSNLIYTNELILKIYPNDIYETKIKRTKNNILVFKVGYSDKILKDPNTPNEIRKSPKLIKKLIRAYQEHFNLVTQVIKVYNTIPIKFNTLLDLINYYKSIE